MTGDLLNLNRARKARAKADAGAKAAANRVSFGLTKAQRDTARFERERAERLLDSHKRDD